MNNGTYHFIAGVLDHFLWGGELVGDENLPREGPAVFVANHLDAAGPIATVCSIPLRLHPWVIADMMDKDLAPLWLQADFVERQMHLKPPISQWLARAICRISVPLFYSVGCIPVYHGNYERLQETMNISISVLRQGKFILIFPEDNLLPKDPLTKMQPFKSGFIRLAEQYYLETGKRLDFHPLTIHGTGYLVAGKPVEFNPNNPTGLERRRIKSLLETQIISTYLQLEAGNLVGQLTSDGK
jgi:hypothetical protein